MRREIRYRCQHVVFCLPYFLRIRVPWTTTLNLWCLRLQGFWASWDLRFIVSFGHTVTHTAQRVFGCRWYSASGSYRSSLLKDSARESSTNLWFEIIMSGLVCAFGISKMVDVCSIYFANLACCSTLQVKIVGQNLKTKMLKESKPRQNDEIK